MKLTENFSLSEFKCPREGMPEGEILDHTKELAENLQVLRDEIGLPIRIISAYRSPDYNKSIGGAERSQHMYGKASDIKVKGMEPVEVHKVVLRLISEGKMKQGGVGLYETFVHYDIRGTRARW